MSAQHLEVLETTVQKTHQWIDAVADASHLDTHTAYQALRAVLQTLRDRLPAPEAAHLGAQLPMLIRGLYYEGWRPSESPVLLDRESFLKRVSNRMVSSRILEPAALCRTVFTVMNHFLCEGELEKLCSILPKEISNLFPAHTPSQ